MLRLTLIGATCPDRPGVSTHEDNVRSASARQLDAAEKMDSLRCNQESMKSSADSVSSISESAFVPRALDHAAEAAAVPGSNDAFTARSVASLSPPLIRAPRQKTNALRPKEIGNFYICACTVFVRMWLAY